MIFDEQLSSLIAAKINEFIAGPATGPMYLRNLVAEWNALLLVCDLDGYLALRPNGEIIFIPDEPSAVARLEHDPVRRNLALVQGSKIYPELKQIIPPKPIRARVCPDCNGTGILPIAALPQFKNVICRCGGIGWLP